MNQIFSFYTFVILLFLSRSTLVRLLFGHPSDLVWSFFGIHPNKVRTRSERKKTESGRRVEREWNETPVRDFALAMLKMVDSVAEACASVAEDGWCGHQPWRM